MSDPRIEIVEACQLFYRLGWVSGTGGGMSIMQDGRIYVAPSGVEKEKLAPEDIFVLDTIGEIVEAPSGDLKLSQCTPLFMAAYIQRDAGAVLHSHSVHALMASIAFEDVFRCTHLEMMKGIEGTEYGDMLEVPIIENTAHECDLADALSAVIDLYPKSNAVLVRRHGVYIWGRDAVHAKTQAECYHYLFEAALKMQALGIDAAVAPRSSGIQVYKWPHKHLPNAKNVAAEMRKYGYGVYDLQTVPAWFDRSRHSHDEPEIRGAVAGVITFHFDSGPVTIEAGDILLIPAGEAHAVKGHNGRTFTAYKGSISGERHVTEYGDGQGSIEDLARR